MKNFYEQLDIEQNATFRNIDSLMKDLDAESLFDLGDMPFDMDEY